MKADADLLARQLEQLAVESRRRQGSVHPTAQQLAGYHERTLDSAALDEVQDHLAVCPECTQELLELARFEEAMAAEATEEAAGGPSDAQAEASWQALRARLASPPLADAQPPAVVAPKRAPRRQPAPRTLLALAAGLFACVIGLQLWLSLHGARPAGRDLILVQPGAFEVTRGPEDARHPINVSLGGAAAVLSLPVPVRSAYRFEIRTLSGELRLAGTPVRVPMASSPDAAASLDSGEERIVSFGLPRGSLPGGDYRLRLIGLQGARDETLAVHRLRILNP